MKEALTANMNGKILQLVRETEEEAEFDLTIRATSDGLYVDFCIHVVIREVEGVDENTTSFMVCPNPTNGILMLAVKEAFGFVYHIYGLMGQCVMSGKVVGDETRLDLGGLNKGVYYITVEYGNNRLTQEIIVR